MKVIKALGGALFILGMMAADSACLLIPLGLIVAGAGLVAISVMNNERME